MSRKTQRTREQILAAVNKAVKLIEGGMPVEKAKKKARVSNSSWALHRPATVGGKPVTKRRSSATVNELVETAHGLIMGGMTVDAAAKKVGIGRSLYDKVRKRLKLAPRGATRGSVRTDMLPPRPEKKKTYTSVFMEPDMNSVQQLAAKIGHIDKKLAAVAGLTTRRKTYAKRLMALLRKGA